MTQRLSPKEITVFRAVVRNHFKKYGRSFPWRETIDPYKILVSEVMLQQTQVERVIPKYKEFLKQFPTIAKLVDASLGDVLRAWSGLGYNRRAKMLWECARQITKEYKGVFPKTYSELIQLRGVGPYTAGAVSAFAYNKPVVMIETNIRSVYLHHFFKDTEGVSDKELLPIIGATLDQKNPRLWYNMLMDYGASLKALHGNPNRKSKHHTKQKLFKDSDREIRGAILRAIGENALTATGLTKKLKKHPERIRLQLEKLEEEGMAVLTKGKWQLP